MTKGFIAGAFDIIHPGYIDMFSECKQNCDYLIVGLQGDPTIERPNKLKPILSIEDRKKILLSIKWIDEVIIYNIESELLSILENNNLNMRFLGDDYIDKEFTGKDLNIPIHFISRDHEWSSTKFKKLIYESIKG